MDRYLSLVFIGPQQLIPIAVAAVLWCGLAGLGSLITGRDRFVDVNVLYGWAAVSTGFTLVGAWVRAPFLILAILFGILAVAGIVLALRRGQALFPPGAWRVAVLALPVLLIAGAMEPSQWDEFSHWLPAPKYLLAFDGFPNAAQPYNGPYMLSAYPYGWPILSYLGARLAGGFIDNLGGVLNLSLLLTFVTFAIRTGYRIATDRAMERIGWGAAAAVVLAATILNPSFVQKIVLTAYSDVSTSVTVGFSALLAYHFIESAAGRGTASARSAAWQFALVIALLVNLRQANVVLMVVLLTGMTVIALRDPAISMKRYLPLTGLALVPAILVYGIWRLYVARELAGIPGGEAAFQPLAQWNFAEIPGILWQMLVVAGKKIGFFAPMALACYFAVRGLIRYRTAFDRIAILVAIGFIGQNAFLFLTYLGHFVAYDALRVVSYWRYNTQVGALAIMFIVIGVLYLAHRRSGRGHYPTWLKGAAIGLAVILPLALPHKLRFDLEAPKPHYFKVARDLVGVVPAEAKLWVIDPQGTGESAMISRYVLDKFGQSWLAAAQNTGPEAVASYVARTAPDDYLLVHSTAAGVSEALGVPISAAQSYLLRRDAAGWRVLRRWPKPDGHQG